MERTLSARDIQSYIKLIVWTLVIAYLCFSSGTNIDGLKINLIPLWLKPYMDKIVHFIMFFVLAFIIKSLYWQKTIDMKPYYVLLTAGATYAALTEIVQYYLIPTRSGDVRDFACDLVGMTLSVFVFPYWPKFVKRIFG